MRVGFGTDTHRLIRGRELIIGGVHVPFDRGLAGHSDADVLAHAVTDAILGAAGMGDIGHHFPDSEARYKDADSIGLLAEAMQMVSAGFEVANIDATVVAQAPRLEPYIRQMSGNIAQAVGAQGRVNIKATTTEGLGFEGSGQGITAYAVCLLQEV